MANPTWYDILGITPEATPEQVKAAWRDATDKFEPGTGASQFRLFNEAADVLLDPVKRAAYDAELGLDATPAAEVETAPEPAAEPGTVAETETETEPEPEPAADVASSDEPAAPTGGLSVGVMVVAVLSVLAVASLVLAAIFGVRLHNRVSNAQADADAAAEASAVAERAMAVVLAYDYRHMDADWDRSEKFMTAKYAKKVEPTFQLLVEGPNGTPGPAIKTKTVVTANVLNTAVQDADRNKVRVLVFVNQSSVKGSDSPLVFQNRVVATMVRSGDDWLISDVQSY